MTDTIVLEAIKNGGVSGILVSMALVYLAVQVRSLKTAIDEVRQTIGEHVLPRLDEHTAEINFLKGVMRKTDP